jgi:hypothetical protein
VLFRAVIRRDVRVIRRCLGPALMPISAVAVTLESRFASHLSGFS